MYFIVIAYIALMLNHNYLYNTITYKESSVFTVSVCSAVLALF